MKIKDSAIVSVRIDEQQKKELEGLSEKLFNEKNLSLLIRNIIKKYLFSFKDNKNGNINKK